MISKNTAIIIVALTGMVSCTRSTQSPETTPVQQPSTQSQGNGNTPANNNSNSQTPTVTTDQESTNANSTNTNDEVVTIQQPLMCFDSSGKEITGQFQDQSKNSNPANIIDCHDDEGNILYKGTAKNCFEEMQIRFGPDIIFPSQQLFPKQYEAARAQGAGGQAALKQALASASCRDLKAKE
jgi:hypothetical protein